MVILCVDFDWKKQNILVQLALLLRCEAYLLWSKICYICWYVRTYVHLIQYRQYISLNIANVLAKIPMSDTEFYEFLREMPPKWGHMGGEGSSPKEDILIPKSKTLLQLDWVSAIRKRKINLPANRKGYDESEIVYEKLSARRIQIFLVQKK